MLNTRLNDLLGITRPVLLGGMAWITGWEMAAAVSRAGGLGTIASAMIESEVLEDHIRRLREETSKPFALNIPLRIETSKRAVEIALAEQVPVVVSSAGDPGTFADKFRARGIKILQVAFTRQMVKRCNDVGVDGVIAMGVEAGGNINPSEISSLVLVREAAEETDLPVIAAGGIADGHGLAAALALGAEGIQMGTRFLATREGTLHAAYKRTLLEARDADTTITGRTTGLQFRVFRNRMAMKVLQMESEGRERTEIDTYTIGSLKRAALEGDVEWGSLMMGQVAGLIRDLPSIKDVMEGITAGAEKEIRRLNQLIT